MQFDEFEFFSSDAAPKAAAPEAGTRLQYLIDNTPAIIYSTVPSGDFKMTFVSNNAYHLLGYRPEQMTADPNFWFDHIHPDDAPNIFSSLALVFTEGQRAYEYRFRTHDGSYLWVHDTLRLIRDEHGAPLEVVGALTDITARKQMEEALRAKGEEQQKLIAQLGAAQQQLLQAEKLASIGQLAAGVAHEINNPLGFVNSNMTSLNNYVGSLLGVIGEYETAAAAQPGVAATMAQVRERADLDFVRDDVQALVRESMDGLRRVRDIVQALKDFSHVGEAGWQVADLHQGLDSTLNIVSNELKFKARIDKHYGELPPVTCMASQLNQVFMNLLVNAGQAIRDQGVITLRTGSKDDWVWVAVTDTGVGIPRENLNRIFEPFFTTKPVGSGTGLGLSLSYGIVQKHGGRIEVASVQGRGTCFTVRLPVTPPASQTSPK
jgi:PAS domain S-box-containing protein